MVAMLVTPAATAYLLTNRLPRMMMLAAIIAILSSVIGLYISFYLGISSGAAVVLTCTVFFVLAWAIKGLKKVTLRSTRQLPM